MNKMKEIYKKVGSLENSKSLYVLRHRLKRNNKTQEGIFKIMDGKLYYNINHSTTLNNLRFRLERFSFLDIKYIKAFEKLNKDKKDKR